MVKKIMRDPLFLAQKSVKKTDAIKASGISAAVFKVAK